MLDRRQSLGQALITGVYRSGSEFVSLLISGHPDLSATMYHVNALRFLSGRYEPIADAGNLARAVADTATRLEERYGIEMDTGRVLSRCRNLETIDVCTVYDVIMSELWLGGGKRHWAEKCQLVWREVPEFLDLMPCGRAILVIRDPRSILASFKRYTYAPPPAYLGAILNCLDAMTKALTYLDRFPPDRFRVVRYEGAAREPAAVAAELFEFLGLDPASGPVDRSRWTDSLGNPWVANSAFAENDSDFDVEKAIERWKGGLKDWEIALTETVCGSCMTAFGYELSGLIADWSDVLPVIRSDNDLNSRFEHWRTTGEGMQAFPTDPVDSRNWEENRTTGR